MQSITAMWIEEMERIIRRGQGFNLSDKELGTLMSGLEYLSAVIDQAGTLKADFHKLEDDYEQVKLKYEAALGIIREMAETLNDCEEIIDQKNKDLELYADDPGPCTTWYAAWTQGWNAQREGGSMADCGPSFERFRSQWEEGINGLADMTLEAQEDGEWDDFLDAFTATLDEVLDRAEQVADDVDQLTVIHVNLADIDDPKINVETHYFKDETFEIEVQDTDLSDLNLSDEDREMFWEAYTNRTFSEIPEDEDGFCATDRLYEEDPFPLEECEECDEPPTDLPDMKLRSFFGPPVKRNEQQLHAQHDKLCVNEKLETPVQADPDLKETVKKATKAYEKMMEISPTEYYQLKHKISMFERRIDQLERELAGR